MFSIKSPVDVSLSAAPGLTDSEHTHTPTHTHTHTHTRASLSCIIPTHNFQIVGNSLIEYQQLETLTAGSESLANTVVTMVPLTALGATMPRYTDWLNTGEKSFMSWREI